MVLTHARMNVGIERCIQNCSHAHEACLELIDYALKKGGRYAESERIKLYEDVAGICGATADFLVRDSKRHPVVCRACASICEEAARDCEGFEDDDFMHRCAEVCRRCSQSCEALAGVPF